MSLRTKTDVLIDRALRLLNTKPTAAEITETQREITKRMAEIDAKLQALTGPGGGRPTGGPAYEEALAAGVEQLTAVKREREELEAERAILARRARDLRDLRQRVQVRESHRKTEEHLDLLDAAEAALVAHKRALKKLQRLTSDLDQNRNLAARLGEEPPKVDTAQAIRAARLLCNEGRHLNEQRVRMLKSLGAPATRHLVHQAGLEPGAPVVIESPDSANEREAGAVNA